MEKPKQKQQAYLKLEAEEASAARRDVLSIQMNLLQIISKISAYRKLRKQENRHRIELKKRLKDIKSEIKDVLTGLPVVERPKIKLYKKSSTSSGGKEKKTYQKENTLKKSIDAQLAEIKARLQKLDEK